MSNSPWKYRHRRCLVAAIGVLALSGFAGHANELKPVKIGQPRFESLIGPLQYLANDPAEVPIVKKNGLDVQWFQFGGSSPNCVTALIAGHIDVCTSGAATPVNAIADKANLVLIGGGAKPHTELVIRTDVAKRLGLTENSSIEDRLRAMKGLKVASSAVGTSHTTYLAYLLNNLGLGLNDLSMVVMTDATAQQEAMRNKAIDVVMWNNGSMARMLSEGIAVPLFRMGDVPQIANVMAISIAARKDWVERDPARAEAVMRSFYQAVVAINKDPAAAAKAVKSKYFAAMPDDIWQPLWDASYPTWGAGKSDQDIKVPQSTWDVFMQLQRLGNPAKVFDHVKYDDVVVPFARGQ